MYYTHAFQKSLQLLTSKSNLITKLFWTPCPSKDTAHAINSFRRRSSVDHEIGLRKFINAHLVPVRDICTPPRSLLQARNTGGRGRESQAIIDTCTTAIQIVDKPNVHRLAELSATTLHMFTTISHIGELVLKKRHQILKRAARRANNLEPHHHAMNTVIFNDWQARLTMNLPQAHEGDADARRACYCLLQGRETVHMCQGSPTLEDMQCTMNALLQNSPLTNELRLQGLSLGAKRVRQNGVPSTFRASRADIFTQSDSSASFLLRSLRSVHLDAIGPFVWRKKIKLPSPQSQLLQHVKRHSVLRTLVPSSAYCPNHFPFVKPVTGSESGDNCRYWAVIDIVSVKTDSLSWTHSARVLPVCPRIVENEQMFATNTLSEPRLLQLTSATQIAACIHNCSSGACSPTTSPPGIEHFPGVQSLDGAPFYLLSRSHGFPPRAG